MRTERSGVEPSYWAPVATTTRSGSKKEPLTETIPPSLSKAKFFGAVMTESVIDQLLASSSARKPSLKAWFTNSGYSSLWKARSNERQFAPAGTMRSRRRIEGSKLPRPSVSLSEPAPVSSFGPGASVTSPEVRRSEVPLKGGKTVVVGPTAALARIELHMNQRSETTRPPWSSEEATAGQGSSVTVVVEVARPSEIVYVNESLAPRLEVCE